MTKNIMKDFVLLSGSSNLPLASEIAKILTIPLGKVDLERFADGELRPWIQEDVRDKTAIVIESLFNPIDEHVMELVLMGDALRRMAPKNMIAVIPYMGYSRQDKLHRLGEPVSARVIAKFLEVSRFSEIIAVDLHNDAIVGFFEVPVTHVSALPLLAEKVKAMHLTNAVIISPDVGGVKRARNLAYLLDMDMVVMEKKRFLDKHDTSEMYQIIGDVKGKTAVIIDDIISTGGTTAAAAVSLKDAGAERVVAMTTHGVLAGDAKNKLSNAPIDTVICSNSIEIPQEKQFEKLEIVSIAPLLADAISTLVR
jgi:ribose-phosphate pyrophosphokinase